MRVRPASDAVGMRARTGRSHWVPCFGDVHRCGALGCGFSSAGTFAFCLVHGAWLVASEVSSAFLAAFAGGSARWWAAFGLRAPLLGLQGGALGMLWARRLAGRMLGHRALSGL